MVSLNEFAENAISSLELKFVSKKTFSAGVLQSSPISGGKDELRRHYGAASAEENSALQAIQMVCIWFFHCSGPRNGFLIVSALFSFFLGRTPFQNNLC